MEAKTTQGISKKEIMELCKSDRTFAEQLYSELYIYLHYNESVVDVDVQTCEATETKPTWLQNFAYRIRQALRTKGIEVEFDASEMVQIIKEGACEPYGLQLI